MSSLEFNLGLALAALVDVLDKPWNYTGDPEYSYDDVMRGVLVQADLLIDAWKAKYGEELDGNKSTAFYGLS